MHSVFVLYSFGQMEFNELEPTQKSAHTFPSDIHECFLHKSVYGIFKAIVWQRKQKEVGNG